MVLLPLVVGCGGGQGCPSLGANRSGAYQASVPLAGTDHRGQ